MSNSSDKEIMAHALRRMQCFSSWSSTAMSLLLASCQLRWHARGDLLPTPGKNPMLFVIVRGHAVQFETSPNGTRLHWAVRGPGHLLGFSYMFPLKESRREYVANDEVVAIHIPGALLFDLLDRDPSRWKDMGRMLVRHEREVIDLVLGHIAGELSHRLARTIEQLCALHGTKATEDGPTHLRLTQKDLAGLLRVTRQTVSKELSLLEGSGAIKLGYNEILVLDRSALRKISRVRAPKEGGAAA